VGRGFRGGGGEKKRRRIKGGGGGNEGERSGQVLHFLLVKRHDLS